MRPKPATVADFYVVDGDQSGAATDPSCANAGDRFDTSPSIGRDAYRLASREATVGTGTIVIGLLWLALYVFAAVSTLTSEHHESTSTPKTVPAKVTAPR